MSAALRTMPNDPNAKLNRLLAALPEASFKRLAPDLEYITMTRGENLCESGRGAKYLYFPTSGAVALVLVLKNGIRAGTSTVGREGVVGIGLFLAFNSLAQLIWGSDTKRVPTAFGDHVWRVGDVPVSAANIGLAATRAMESTRTRVVVTGLA